jgi:hypothetical protein
MPDYLSEEANTAVIFAAPTGEHALPDATRADRITIAVFGVLRYTAATFEEIADAIGVDHDDPEYAECLYEQLQDTGGVCWDEATGMLYLSDGPAPADRLQAEHDAGVDESAAYAAAADRTAEDLYPEAWRVARQAEPDLVLA